MWANKTSIVPKQALSSIKKEDTRRPISVGFEFNEYSKTIFHCKLKLAKDPSELVISRTSNPLLSTNSPISSYMFRNTSLIYQRWRGNCARDY